MGTGADVPLLAATIILGQRVVAWTMAVMVTVLMVRKVKFKMSRVHSYMF